MTNAHETTDKILDHNRLQLSALIDGELPPDAARFLLRRLQHDAELGGCWERWQLCGDVLRGQVGMALPAEFAVRVGERIRLEPAAAAKRSLTAGARGLRWGGGLALAASVAVVAMLLVRQSPNALAPDQGAPARMAAVAPAPGTPVGSVAPSPAIGLPVVPDRAGEFVTAVAAADVPRRLAARRSRGQSQRAALRAGMPRSVAAVPTVLAASGSSTGTATPPFDPFAARQANLPSRPWPRALLPGGSAGAYTVDYGRRSNAGTTAASFYPFEPRPQPSLVEIPADGGDSP